MDARVGRAIAALEEEPNTYVIIFSDHGEYLGNYDLIEKWPADMHDCLARDPFTMAGPRHPVSSGIGGVTVSRTALTHYQCGRAL